jgi:LPS-assembly protein
MRPIAGIKPGADRTTGMNVSKNKFWLLAAGAILNLPNAVLAVENGKWNCSSINGGSGWDCSGNNSLPLDQVAESPRLAQVETADSSKSNVVALPEPEVAQPAEVGEEPKIAARVDAPSAEQSATGERVSSAQSDIDSQESEPSEQQKRFEERKQRVSGVSAVIEGYSHGNRIDHLDEGLDWDRCGRQAEKIYVPSSSSDRDDQNIYISSDASEFYRREKSAIFAGNVEAVQGEQYIEADWMRYYREGGRLVTKGDVYYESPSLRFVADEGDFYPDESKGVATGMKEYRIPSGPARGSADRGEILDAERSRFENVTYTTCRPGNSDWKVQADNMEIDKGAGWAVAKNATVKFKGVPVLYSPYFRYPIDKRRMSGFLMPTIGSSNRTGLDITAPYYFNIAPNSDATLYPRVMSDRGLMLGGEYRFLNEKYRGEIRGEYLPNDSGQTVGEETDRGSFSIRLKGNPAPRWSTNLDVDYVSDEDYVKDFGSNLGVTSAVHLQRLAEASYNGDIWDFTARVQNYQTVDGVIASGPYSRLPQLLATMTMPDESTGLTYHMRGEYVYFDHEENVHGQRIDLMPGVSYPVRRPWGHFVPKLSARYTGYQLENQDVGDPSNPDRLLPILSLDGGLVFERTTSWFGRAATQTLEPRLFYLYTPYENQDDLPVFDTSKNGIDFGTFFRENRFTGADRQGDANQVTTAVTSRFLSEETGHEWLNASLGQVLYFDDRNVQLPGVEIEDKNTSSIFAEAVSQLTPDWYTRAFIQWDPHQDEMEKGAVELRYRDDDSRVFNLAYRYEQSTQEQIDTSFHWPMGSKWSTVGRWNYSVLNDKSLDILGGIEYSECCWAFRFVGRKFANDDASNDDSTLGIFLQLELKGLGALGNAADVAMEEGVLGYKARH